MNLILLEYKSDSVYTTGKKRKGNYVYKGAVVPAQLDTWNFSSVKMIVFSALRSEHLNTGLLSSPSTHTTNTG